MEGKAHAGFHSNWQLHLVNTVTSKTSAKLISKIIWYSLLLEQNLQTLDPPWHKAYPLP